MKTSTQVATELGMSRGTLVILLFRHPELRPTNKTGNPNINLHLWDDDEIERVRAHRAAFKSGRPRKVQAQV